MNNENEIVKEFNKKFTDNSEPMIETYHATQNVNNFTQSQEFTDNMATSILNNNENITMQNFVRTDSPVNTVPEVNNIINTNNSNSAYGINNMENNNVNYQNFVQTDNNQQLYDTTTYINDSDRTIEKKPKKATVKINPELETIILIAAILLISMAFVPTLFDIYDSLRIKIFG